MPVSERRGTPEAEDSPMSEAIQPTHVPLDESRPRPVWVQPRPVIELASTPQRLLAAFLDFVPVAALTVGLWRLGVGGFSELVPADLGFLPEHIADLYNRSPWMLLRPFALLAMVGVLWMGGWQALGRTPGKLVAGIQVVDEEGERLEIAAQVLRLIGYTASVVTLGFGWMLWLLLPSKRTLHDLLSGSRVVQAARRRG